MQVFAFSNVQLSRGISKTLTFCQNENEILTENDLPNDEVTSEPKKDIEGGRLIMKTVDVHTSIRYLQSKCKHIFSCVKNLKIPRSYIFK